MNLEYVLADNSTRDRLGLAHRAIAGLVPMAEQWLSELSDHAGLQLAVMHRHQLLLSLWGGSDPFRGRRIERHTLFPILSATKGVASLVLLHLHHRGYFNWHDPVVNFWPRFGEHGKGATTVEHVLSHRLGLPNVTTDWWHWSDRHFMRRLVEAAAPAWAPGSQYGYHGGSWGVIVDELVRRWTGQQTGEVLRDAITCKMGVSDECFLGLPVDRYTDVARLLYVEHDQREGLPPTAPIGPSADYNALSVLSSCQSSGGCVTSAEGLAAIYGLLASGGRTPGKETLWTADDQLVATTARNDPRAEEPAARTELRFAWGLGFMVPPSAMVFGTVPLSDRTAGHPGASGAIGYADPDMHLSVGLTINGVGGSQVYRRYQQLGDTLRGL